MHLIAIRQDTSLIFTFFTALQDREREKILLFFTCQIDPLPYIIRACFAQKFKPSKNEKARLTNLKKRHLAGGRRIVARKFLYSLLQGWSFTHKISRPLQCF